MADDQPIGRRGLSPDRWRALCEHFHVEPSITLFEVLNPVEIEGVIYLPALYRPD